MTNAALDDRRHLHRGLVVGDHLRDERAVYPITGRRR
jgi:hypothetical protein